MDVTKRLLFENWQSDSDVTLLQEIRGSWDMDEYVNGKRNVLIKSLNVGLYCKGMCNQTAFHRFTAI